MAAGMEAKAHLIIKITIESNGICISVTTTLLDSDLLSSATEVADGWDGLTNADGLDTTEHSGQDPSIHIFAKRLAPHPSQ